MKALDFIARAVIRFSAPVHKGKSLSSRASTRRQEPPSLPDQPVRPVPNAVNARCLKAKEGIGSATTANNSETPGAELSRRLRCSWNSIGSGPESRPPCPSMTGKPESSISGSEDSRMSPSARLSRPPESTSSGPLRSSTAKTAVLQGRTPPLGLGFNSCKQVEA